jgi:hypothetical protein
VEVMLWTEFERIINNDRILILQVWFISVPGRVP